MSIFNAFFERYAYVGFIVLRFIYLILLISVFYKIAAVVI